MTKQRRSKPREGGRVVPRSRGGDTSRRTGSSGSNPIGGPSRSLQRKITVGEPGSTYEREADAVADAVVGGRTPPAISSLPSGGLSAQRATAPAEEAVQGQTDKAPPVEIPEIKRDDTVQTAIDDELQTQALEEEEAIQTQSLDEEETVQTQSIEDEEEAVQTQSIEDEELLQGQSIEDEELLQGQSIEDEELLQGQSIEDEELLQGQSIEDEELLQGLDAGGRPTTTGAARRALRQAGSGAPIPAPTRSRLESGIGADLGHVRVHEGPTAAEANRELRSRAFTHGSDIWLGGHESPSDVQLMSHEAAHVAQQSHSLQRLVQRQNGGGNAAPPAAPVTHWARGGDDIDTAAKRITLAQVSVLPEKREFMPGTISFPYRPTRQTQQSSNWDQQVAPTATAAARSWLSAQQQLQANGQPAYFFKHRRAGGTHELREDSEGRPIGPGASRSVHVIGGADVISGLAGRPIWDKLGNAVGFHVDHRREHQLGGGDTVNNYWLLEQSANVSSGAKIAAEMRQKINALLRAAPPGATGLPANPSTQNAWDVDRAVRDAGYTVTVRSFDDELELNDFAAGKRRANWTGDEIRSGAPYRFLVPMSQEEVDAAGGTPQLLKIYRSSTGGRYEELEWGRDDQQDPDVRDNLAWPFYKNIVINQVRFETGTNTGRVTGKFQPKPNSDVEPADFDQPIAPIAGLQYSGYISGLNLWQQMRGDISFTPFSPIEWDTMGLDPEKGLVASGRILPSIPAIERADIRIVIDGEDVYLSKLFVADDFNLPGPIDLTESTLEIRLGTQGLVAIGQVQFEVRNIGSGSITAEVGTESGLSLEGQFQFLSDLFEPAEVRVWYRKEGEEYVLGGSGTLTIPEGKVKGIKTATVTATIENESISASGTFEADFPGVESGALSFTYNPEEGYAIGGSLDLSSDIPGIESGRLEATLARAAEEESWKLSGAITATPSIPGITSTISGSYDDGAFTIEGTAQYERGMAAGQVRVGVTNRAPDDEGNPTGEPTDELTAFGGGSVTLTIAPWLQATVGLSLLPNGEIEVSGEIGLPDALEIFPQKALEKEIFSINIDIPILGFAVAGQRVGIFATVGGGLSASASLGPAELQDLSLGITWNPDHQEDTTVTGGARLHLPANAGLRLFIRGGLGAGIPLVSAVLGIEIGGTLGIEAAIGAAVDVNWTPATGLVIDALAEAYAQPKFTFDVTGFAEVEVDLPWPLGDITLYEERWNFASFEYGADLRLGMKLPVHFQEGEPFDPSIDDVEFEIPQVNPREVLAGLVDQLI